MMDDQLSEAMVVLERTPHVLSGLLAGLPEGWLRSSEGEGRWNAAEVVAHLAEAERVNWIPRLEWLLREGETKPFPPFDRDAHLREEEVPCDVQLERFRRLRQASMHRLRQLAAADSGLLERTGAHPEFGPVRASELLSTWVVHDLAHTAQIVRAMAVRYREDVGPWKAYLRILDERR